MDHKKSRRLASRHPHSLHWRIVPSVLRALKGPERGNRKLKLLGAGAVLALGLSTIGAAEDAAADVLYTYTGNPFTDTSSTGVPPATYTTSDSVTGSFTLPTALAANQTDIFITPSTFSFFDGIQTINQNTADLETFRVSTDQNADLSGWSIEVEAPTTALTPTACHIIDIGEQNDGTPGNSAILANKGIDCFITATNYSAEGTTPTTGSWMGPPQTAPAPVVGAGLPGVLAGVAAFLFWRGRAAVVAFFRRRQPVAS